jgi:hypothetical protein
MTIKTHEEILEAASTSNDVGIRMQYLLWTELTELEHCVLVGNRLPYSKHQELHPHIDGPGDEE